MYNRVGLKTTRGSGTSGYVQASKAARRPIKSKLEFLKEMKRLKETQLPINLKPNEEILRHKQKRQIYAFLEELRESLISAGKTEEEIEPLITETEANLLQKFERGELVISLGDRERNNTHVVARAKQEEDEKIRKAFGIKDDYEIGNAFDFELQERQRLERIYKRELERVNRMELEAMNANNLEIWAEELPVQPINELPADEDADAQQEDVDRHSEELQDQNEPVEEPKPIELVEDPNYVAHMESVEPQQDINHREPQITKLSQSEQLSEELLPQQIQEPPRDLKEHDANVEDVQLSESEHEKRKKDIKKEKRRDRRRSREHRHRDNSRGDYSTDRKREDRKKRNKKRKRSVSSSSSLSD